MKRLLVTTCVVWLAGCQCNKTVAKDPVVPAAAYQNVGGAPGAQQALANFGQGIAVALDANGDPAVVFGSFDANGDSDFADSKILFSRWDAATKKYRTPVEVSSPGDSRGLTLSLAVDGNTVTVAWAKTSDDGAFKRSIWLASSSDGGATFSTSLISDGTSIFGHVTMAVSNGIAHVAWNEDGHVKYRFGPVANTSTWSAAVEIPNAPETEASVNGKLSLAIDSNGAPALVFGLTESNHLTYTYWRPTFTNAKPVVATGAQNDFWSVVLAFQGTTPRVAMHYASGLLPDVVSVTSSTNDGDAWSDAVAIANDGDQRPNDRLAFAVGAAGQSAISYGVGGGGAAAPKCGEPKLARSSSFTGFATCSPFKDTEFAPDWPALRFTANGKLVLAFQRTSSPGGVLVWREP